MPASEPIANPALQEAIDAWSGTPGPGAQQVLEAALGGATFLVAAHVPHAPPMAVPVLTQGTDVSIVFAEGEGGARLLTAFSDWDALHAFVPPPVDGIVMSATELWDFAIADGLAGIVLDGATRPLLLDPAWIRSLRTGTPVVPALASLLEAPQGVRHEGWTYRFETALEQTGLGPGPQGRFVGPDGYPYLDVRVGGSKSLADFARAGVAGCHGLVLDADRGDYVLPVGRLVDLLLHGTLAAPALPSGDGEESAMVGPPSEAILPASVRAGLRAWAQKRHGLTGLRIALLRDLSEVPPRSIVFDVGNAAPSDAMKRFLQGAAWFLPRTAPPAVAPGAAFPFAPL